MSDREHEYEYEYETAFDDDDTTTAVIEPDADIDTELAPPRVLRLPPWQVLLHNDDVSDMLDVIDAIIELTTLNRQEAVASMLELHTRGIALLLTTHREHAELLQEQFESKRLTVTIEAF